MGFGDAANGQHSWTLDEEHSREIIKRGLELGVNFFDTAIGYQSGTSEQYVGRALWDFAKRDEVFVATKFLPRTQEDIAAGITGQQHIERMVNKSLANLGMDHVDLYIYHMWDYQTPLYDIMEGLNNIVKAGKVRYIGISNCFAWQLAKANALAEKEGFAKFVSIQGHYNLIFREEEREMAKLCAEDNIAMTPYSALADHLADIAGCDAIFVGFPVWWYTAPTIIKTFLEAYDFSGKTIVPFATSGGSGLGKTADTLQEVVPLATVKSGKLLNGRQNATELKKWAESLGK